MHSSSHGKICDSSVLLVVKTVNSKILKRNSYKISAKHQIIDKRCDVHWRYESGLPERGRAALTAVFVEDENAWKAEDRLG